MSSGSIKPLDLFITSIWSIIHEVGVAGGSKKFVILLRIQKTRSRNILEKYMGIYSGYLISSELLTRYFTKNNIGEFFGTKTENSLIEDISVKQHIQNLTIFISTICNLLKIQNSFDNGELPFLGKFVCESRLLLGKLFTLVGDRNSAMENLMPAVRMISLEACEWLKHHIPNLTHAEKTEISSIMYKWKIDNQPLTYIQYKLNNMDKSLLPNPENSTDPPSRFDESEFIEIPETTEDSKPQISLVPLKKRKNITQTQINIDAITTREVFDDSVINDISAEDRKILALLKILRDDQEIGSNALEMLKKGNETSDRPNTNKVICRDVYLDRKRERIHEQRRKEDLEYIRRRREHRDYDDSKKSREHRDYDDSKKSREHRDYGRVSDHRTSRVSDHRTSRVSDHRTSRVSDHRTSRASDHRTSRVSDHRASRVSDHRASRVSDHRTSRDRSPERQSKPTEKPYSKIRARIPVSNRFDLAITEFNILGDIYISVSAANYALKHVSESFNEYIVELRFPVSMIDSDGIRGTPDRGGFKHLIERFNVCGSLESMIHILEFTIREQIFEYFEFFAYALKSSNDPAGIFIDIMRKEFIMQENRKKRNNKLEERTLNLISDLKKMRPSITSYGLCHIDNIERRILHGDDE